MNLSSILVKLMAQEAKKSAALERLSELQQQAEKLKQSLLLLEQVQVFLQTVAKETQEQLKFHIQDIVQLALDYCFGDKYKFTINFDIKRGQTEAQLRFDLGGESIDPMDASGGGAVEIAAFAIRIAVWTLGRTRATILLDEPFSKVSVGFRPQAAQIIRQLSQKLQIQFIIITHMEEITDVADKIFRVSQNSKFRSIIKEELV